ncbi:MAG: DUF2807 domain-containing protein [Bacteroidales bacterium]|nr:DUF2807 domain-containing protein [Bacteroidales bacterium]
MKNTAKLLFSMILIIMVATLTSCFYENGNQKRIEGEGPIVKRVLELEHFDGIIIQNSADVYITRGNTQRIEVEAAENIISNLETEVSGRVWRIRNKRPVWRTKHLQIKITIPEFRLIKVSGSGRVETETPFNNLDDVEIRISGSGNIHLSGEAQRVDFSIAGSGDIFAFDLKANNGTAKISGSGSIRTYITDDLEARITGSGDIIYRGKPRINTRISGSGNIQSR